MALFTRTEILRIVFAVAAVSFATAALIPVRGIVNSTTIALVQLLVIVVVATLFESRAALASSIIAALSFNYFFLPPYHTFSIDDPQNWIAFAVFLAVAITVGHLSAVSNRRRAEAENLYRELESAFEKSSEAEGLKRSEKLKTALLDAVTHDFRTPLTSIKASVTALIDDNQLSRAERSLDHHDRGELLQVINEESDRLNTFVESMVELARFQSGEMELHKTAVSPEEIVIKAARRARVVQAEHKLISEVETRLPAVSADSRSLVEAMFNLIDNAAKYSPAGTDIYIRAGRVKGNVRFSVEDEGPGVAESDRESVFERFSRVSGVHRGLGMGLAIVRGIVEAHGGRVWVEDGPKGARFVFELPAILNGQQKEDTGR